MRYIFLALMLSGIFFLSGQIPADFEPGLRELTSEDWEYLNSLPVLKLNDIKTNRELPDSVDNSEHPWLRPVFNQDGGSCGQASGIGYVFTYEINRLRNLSSDTSARQYPDHYTWNFLNGGYGSGSWYFDGWQIVQAGGCPTIETYGGIFALGQSGWMNGYDKYRSAMENRIDEIVAINVSTEEGLETLKHWFYDHANEEDSGGLVCFGAGVSGLQLQSLPSGSVHSGEYIITDWTLPVNHAITFVGYNDSIRYDYNQDGQFTNDVDINGDSVIDMRDWEIGAVKMLNSWGTGWANNGFCWVMYRTLAEPAETGGIWSGIVHGITAKESYQPLLTLKTTISHDTRNTIAIGAGVSAEANAYQPETEIFFPHFHYQGGDWNMPGNYLPGAQPLEIGFDVTPLLSEIDPLGDMKWWLIVDSQDPTWSGNGTLVSYSLIDEESGEEFLCNQANQGLINDWINYFSIAAGIETETVELVTDELPQAVEGVSYEYQLVAENGNEPYEWALKREYNEETASMGFPSMEWTELNVSDNDDGMAHIELPFTFTFYGNSYDDVTLLTDGSIVFDEAFTYIRNEDNLRSNKCITVYGADLMAYPEFDDGFFYFEGEESVYFLWRVSRYDQPEFNAEFALQLNFDNTINFYYNADNITESSNWAAGISNGDGLSCLITEFSGESSLPLNLYQTFASLPFPQGIELTADGILQGNYQSLSEPEEVYEITVRVTDYLNIYDEEVLTFTGVVLAGEDNQVVPTVTMKQNYPNPFYAAVGRNRTCIDFYLEKAGEVELTIYNLKGEKVKRILKEELTSGNHQAFWDGSTNNTPAASGVYFYKLETGEEILTRKLLLIR